jgi:hypothetical protein
MPIDQAGLKAAILGMMGKAHDAGITPDAAAEQLATAIVNCIKSADVLPGTFANGGGAVAGKGTLV